MSPIPASGAPLAVRTDAGSPRPAPATVASSPNPAAYVPSYHGPDDEAQRQKFHFDPASDRVVMLYDGHDEGDAQISPFSPEPPSPHKGSATGEEANANHGANGQSPSDATGAKRVRGGASRRRGGRRGGGPAKETEYYGASSAAPREATTPAPAKSSTKGGAQSAVIADGQDGWGGSGYDVGSCSGLLSLLVPNPFRLQELPATRPSAAASAAGVDTTSPAAKASSKTSSPIPKTTSPATKSSPKPSGNQETRRIVIPPPADKPSQIPVSTTPISGPKLSRREVDELMAERKRQAQLLEQRHAEVEKDKAAAMAQEHAHIEKSKQAAAEAEKKRFEDENRRKESNKVWEEQEAERRENQRRKLEKMQSREWDSDKKKESPSASQSRATEQRGGGSRAERGGSSGGATSGRPKEAKPEAKAPPKSTDADWSAPGNEAKPLVDEGWK